MEYGVIECVWKEEAWVCGREEWKRWTVGVREEGRGHPSLKVFGGGGSVATQVFSFAKVDFLSKNMDVGRESVAWENVGRERSCNKFADLLPSLFGEGSRVCVRDGSGRE